MNTNEGKHLPVVHCVEGTPGWEIYEGLYTEGADIINKRFEVKALVGVNDEECEEILRFLNCTDYQKSVLMKRGKIIPAWGETE